MLPVPTLIEGSIWTDLFDSDHDQPEVIISSLCDLLHEMDDPKPTTLGTAAAFCIEYSIWVRRISGVAGTPDTGGSVQWWCDFLEEIVLKAVAFVQIKTNDHAHVFEKSMMKIVAMHPVHIPPGNPVQLTGVERAMMIFVKKPWLKQKEVAEEAQCSPSLLSRDPRFKSLVNSYRRSKKLGTEDGIED